MTSGESRTALLRTRYTGEPKLAALHYLRRFGQLFGLVPDATDAGQERLEALLLFALARPHPALPELTVAETLWGLSGASPAPDSLVLWPQDGQAAGLLARWLPTRTNAGELGGVPCLRAVPLLSRSRDTISLGLAGRRAHVELRTAPVALEEAVALAVQAGLEPLWTTDAASRAESEALTGLVKDLGGPRMWSRALRSPALARQAAGAWRERAPLEEELEGPSPARIGPRPSRAATVLRGVVAVLAGDGKGGLGCTTAAYMLAAAVAAGGARVGLLAGRGPRGLAARLGLSAAAGWQDASHQLSAAAGQFQVCELDGVLEQEQLAAARADFDLVVVDADSFAMPRDLAARADAVLALVPDRVSWYEEEIVDERSVRVQIWSRLGDRPAKGVRSLQAFLDGAFEEYVQWRAIEEGTDPAAGLLGDMGDEDIEDEDEDEDDNDGWPAEWTEPYDPENADEVEAFWARANRPPHPVEEEYVLPSEEDAPYLDGWRQDFLRILTPQGLARYTEEWTGVLADWPARNRSRNLRRLRAGVASAEERAEQDEAQVTALAPQAAHLGWDQTEWERESRAWRTAGREERVRVASEEVDCVWTLQRPRPAADLAAELLVLAPAASTSPPAVLALARQRRDVDGHLLAAVGRELRARGRGGLTVIPRSRVLEMWLGTERLDPQALAFGRILAEALAPARS